MHDNVERPVCLNRRVDDCVRLTVVVRAGNDCARALGQLLDQRVQGRFRAGRYREPSSARGKPAGQRCAESSRRSDDHHAPAPDVEQALNRAGSSSFGRLSRNVGRASHNTVTVYCARQNVNVEGQPIDEVVSSSS
jgi:hypothetical protein